MKKIIKDKHIGLKAFFGAFIGGSLVVLIFILFFLPPELVSEPIYELKIVEELRVYELNESNAIIGLGESDVLKIIAWTCESTVEVRDYFNKIYCEGCSFWMELNQKTSPGTCAVLVEAEIQVEVEK